MPVQIDVNATDDMMSRSDVLSNASSATVATDEDEYLPAFSELVKSSLKEKHITKRDLGLIVEETAQHILSRGDMTTKLEYQQFGRAMVQKYPSLDFSSPYSKEKPWVCADVIFFRCWRIKVSRSNFTVYSSQMSSE